MKNNMWMDPLCTSWDGPTRWEHLNDLKESNPLEVAEYAFANNLIHEPANFRDGSNSDSSEKTG